MSALCSLSSTKQDFQTPEARRAHLSGVLMKSGVKWTSIDRTPLGSERILVSFDPQHTWGNGLFENSRCASFLVFSYGRLALVAYSRTTKMRARDLSSFEHLCDSMAKWARENGKARR